MNDDISIDKLEKILDSVCILSPPDKNELYHNIIHAMKNNDQKTASAMILNYIEERLSRIKSDVLSSLEYKREGKISPIFNRVG